MYYLPVGDMHPSSTVVCLVRRNRHLLPVSGQQCITCTDCSVDYRMYNTNIPYAQAVWTQYGTCTYRSAGKTSEVGCILCMCT